MNILQFSRKIMQLVRNELIFGAGNRVADGERTGGWNDTLTIIAEYPLTHDYKKSDGQYYLEFSEDFSDFNKHKPWTRVVPFGCGLDGLIEKHHLDGFFENEQHHNLFRNIAESVAQSMLNKVGKCNHMAELFLYFFSERFDDSERVELHLLSSNFLSHAMIKIVQGENTIYVDPWSEIIFTEAEFDCSIKLILHKLQTEYEAESKKEFSEMPYKNAGYKEKVKGCLTDITAYLLAQKINDSSILPTDSQLAFAPIFCVTNKSNTTNDIPCIQTKTYFNLVQYCREVQLLTERTMPVSPLQQILATRPNPTQSFLTFFPKLGSTAYPAPLALFPVVKTEVQKRLAP